MTGFGENHDHTVGTGFIPAREFQHKIQWRVLVKNHGHSVGAGFIPAREFQH
jgi:hypothetical protein